MARSRAWVAGKTAGLMVSMRGGERVDAGVAVCGVHCDAAGSESAIEQRLNEDAAGFSSPSGALLTFPSFLQPGVKWPGCVRAYSLQIFRVFASRTGAQNFVPW